MTVSSPNLDTEHDVITEAHEESSDEEDAAAKYNKRRVTKMPTNPVKTPLENFFIDLFG